MTKKRKYTNELKIRFHTVKGVDTLNAWKAEIKTRHEGSINKNAEDLAIKFMEDDMVNKHAQNLVAKELNKGFNKLDNKLATSIRKEVGKMSGAIVDNQIPLDLKLTLLMNLLADKDVIDEIKLDDPDNRFLQDPQFINVVKANLQKNRLNKSANND